MWNAIRRLLGRSLVGLFALFLVAGTVPTAVLAAVYGSGNYGSGQYNVGKTQEDPPSEETPAGSESSSSSERSSGSTESSSATTCSATKPTAAPDLFQINAQATRVTLYFSPVLAPRDRYVVSYGTIESAEQHAFEWITDAKGVIAVEVQSLQPHTTYHFKVRAGNGCQPGDWSNVLAISTGQRFPSYRWSSLPRIISTQIAQRVNPATVQRIEMDTKMQGTPSSVPSTRPVIPTPAPEQAPTMQQPQAPPAPSSPSFMERVSGFFSRLFRR